MARGPRCHTIWTAPFLNDYSNSSILDVVYFCPVIVNAFFGKMPENETLKGDMEEKVEVYSEKVERLETKRPIYYFMIIPLAITAVFSIIFCLLPNTFSIYDLVQMAVKDIFGGM